MDYSKKITTKDIINLVKYEMITQDGTLTGIQVEKIINTYLSKIETMLLDGMKVSHMGFGSLQLAKSKSGLPYFVFLQSKNLVNLKAKFDEGKKDNEILQHVD